MDSPQYYSAVQRVAELVEKQQDYPGALQLLQSLVESDLPDIDRSIMCVNMAVVCDRMGHAEHAIAWYDHGITIERPYSRGFVAMQKAAYLAGRGQKAEAAAIYESLLNEPFTTMQERDQIRHNLSAVRA